MKDSTKHQIEGKVLEIKGIVKQKAGDIANDDKLAASGVADQVVGKIEQAVAAVEAKLEK
jgi:uncharacterized protein YjbJ (UPF0337 family)